MTLRTLHQRQRGPSVKTMQGALIRAAASDEHDCLGQPFSRGRVFVDDGIFGPMTQQALDAFQARQHREDPGFSATGVCDAPTWEALGFTSGRAHSQANHGPAAPTPTAQRTHGPQGRRAGQPRAGAGVPPEVQPPEGTEMPPWMAVAWAEHARDIHEAYGVRSNPRIIEYLSIGHVSSALLGSLADRGNKRANSILNHAPDRNQEAFRAARMNTLDEVPWCAAFVGWCLAQIGYTRRNSVHSWGNDFLGARSWRPNDGSRGTPRYGAVCVKEHANKFHVGFMLTHSEGRVQFLGGNQKDRAHHSGGAVTVANYVQHTHYDALTFLWPPDIWPGVDPQP